MTALLSVPAFHQDSQQLLVQLSEELSLLEDALANFHLLPLERRLPGRADYLDQIRIRRELLELLTANA